MAAQDTPSTPPCQSNKENEPPSCLNESKAAGSISDDVFDLILLVAKFFISGLRSQVSVLRPHTGALYESVASGQVVSC